MEEIRYVYTMVLCISRLRYIGADTAGWGEDLEPSTYVVKSFHNATILTEFVHFKCMPPDPPKEHTYNLVVSAPHNKLFLVYPTYILYTSHEKIDYHIFYYSVPVAASSLLLYIRYFLHVSMHMI